jgi:hypothetical protein
LAEVNDAMVIIVNIESLISSESLALFDTSNQGGQE